MIHLLIFKGLPSFQCISHFSRPLHLNLSIHLSLLMSLLLSLSHNLSHLFFFLLLSPLSFFARNAQCDSFSHLGEVYFSIRMQLIPLPAIAPSEERYSEEEEEEEKKLISLFSASLCSLPLHLPAAACTTSPCCLCRCFKLLSSLLFSSPDFTKCTGGGRGGKGAVLLFFF